MPRPRGIPFLVRKSETDGNGYRGGNAGGGKHFPRAELRTHVANEFRIVPDGGHITSPLESREKSASSVSTFSSTPQMGAPAVTASRRSAASSASVPGKTNSVSRPSSLVSLTPG